MNTENKYGVAMKKPLTWKKRKLLPIFVLLSAILLPPFMTCSTLAAEANPVKDAEKAQFLTVEFKNGLFSVSAKNAKLGEVLAVIQQKSGMLIEVIDESLKSRLVSVNFSNMGQINSIEIIKDTAGLGGYGISYKLDKSVDKRKQWAIEKVILVAKGGIEPASLKSELFTKEDEKLILSTINTFKDAVPIKTIYNVFRTEMSRSKEIENFEYTVELDEPIDHIIVTQGKPRANVLMGARLYHNLIKQLNKRLSSGELIKDAYGLYHVSPPGSPFKAVFRVDAEYQIVKGYELYKDNLLLFKANLLPLDSSFSQIEVQVHEVIPGNVITETYLKNP